MSDVTTEQTPRLTRRQAAIIGLFTGIVAGPFEDIQELAEELDSGPVFTHELAFRADEFKEKVKPLFMEIVTLREGNS